MSCKYRQMWSCFKNLVLKKYWCNLNLIWTDGLRCINFLSSKLFCMWDDITSFVFFACMHRLFSILNDCSGSNLHLDYWACSTLTKHEKYFFGWWMTEPSPYVMYNRSPSSGLPLVVFEDKLCTRVLWGKLYVVEFHVVYRMRFTIAYDKFFLKKKLF